MLRWVVYSQKSSPWLAKSLYRPIIRLGHFFLFFIILPLYKIYLVIKKIINKFYAPQVSRHKFFHFFSRRYLIHLVLFIITAFTVATSLNAYETRRDDFGQTSVVANLVTKEDLGSIEEQGLLTEAKKVTRYLGQTDIASRPKATGEEGEENLPSIVAGGSAIVKPILSPLEEELRKRGEIVYYIVQPGDTVSGIAEQFGLTVNTLLWENNLTAYSLIRPGDKLTILPTSGIRHKVAKGETLEKIAKKYNIEIEKIVEANKLASASDIKIGEQLLIPGGKKIYAQPAYSLRTTWYQPPAPTTLTPTGKMIWPSVCRRITQYFTWRHSGIDIACGFNNPIRVAESGVVIKSQGGWNGGYGLVIIVDHGNGVQTLYGHLRSLYVRVGDRVTKGQVIGAEGSSGRSTGPHVHFEVRTGGVRRNPFYYIR